MLTHWSPSSVDVLPERADAWIVADFLAEVPERFHGSLLLAMTRDRAVFAELPDGRPLLLIRTTPAALLHQEGSQARCFPAQRVRNDRAWLLALMPRGAAPERWPLPEGRLSLVEGDAFPEIRIGTRARLAPIPPARPWDWAWSPTLGPVQLTLYVDRTEAQLTSWLRDSLPGGYFVAADTSVRSGESDDAWIAARDGALTFSHGYHRVDESVYARDAFLLRRAASGLLGELTFDLFDCDYGALCASGLSRQSLTDYLDPARNGKNIWKALPTVTISVPPESDIPTFLQRELTRWIGLAPETSLEAIFRQTPIEKLPRHVQVRLPLGAKVSSVEMAAVAGRWNGRVRWQWLEEAEGKVPVNAMATWSKEGAE